VPTCVSVWVRQLVRAREWIGARALACKRARVTANAMAALPDGTSRRQPRRAERDTDNSCHMM
jgi:hypothetical protein